MIATASSPVKLSSGRAGGVALALPLIAFVAQAIWLWEFSIDDAGISWRYARNLALGHGLTWNPGSPPVEGYSNLLWVLVLAAAKWTGLDIEWTSKVLGLLLGAADLCLLHLICRRIWHPARYWWLPVAVVAATPEWAMWTMSGLEIALFAFFILLAILSLSGSGRLMTGLLSVGLCGLILTRPEGIGVAFLMIVLQAAAGPREEWRARLRAVRGPAMATIAIILLSLLLRMIYYGYPLPNTVYAKFAPGLPSWPQALRWLFFTLPAWPAWVLVIRNRQPSSRQVVLITALVIAAAHTLMILPVTPVMDFLHRYHMPCWPLAALAIPALAASVSRRRAWLGLALSAFILVWCAQGLPQVAKRRSADRYTQIVQRCVVEQLTALPGRPTVAAIDAGRIPYWSDLPAIDVWGLCDREVAHAGFSPAIIVARKPEVYVMAVDVATEGLLAPALGMDQLMIRDSAFASRYRFWKACLGGTTSYDWRYDYAILLDTAWARAAGVSFDQQLGTMRR